MVDVKKISANDMPVVVDIVDELKSFDKVKSRIFPKLVAKNRFCRVDGTDELADMAHTMRGDMVNVYGINIADADGVEIGMIFISNAMLDDWGISVNKLDLISYENLGRDNPAKVRTMQEIMNEMTGVDLPDGGTPQIVVTTKDQLNGATAMFLDGVLGQVVGRLGGSFFALPSSVHEWICIPFDEFHSVDDLENMVRTINQDGVDERDRLSDNVYFFDMNRNEFGLARELLC